MRLVCAITLLLPGLLAAASGEEFRTPLLQVDVTPEQVRVGEPVTLRVTVLTPTWFPKPPVYPSFELPNAITRLPPDSSHPISRRVILETWSGIVREYQIYPLLSATYVLPQQTVGVTYTDLETARPTRVEVPVPAIEFSATVPEGAAALDPYLAGTRFTLTREIEGDADAVRVGDALVVRYAAELQGMPGLFLPPMSRDMADSKAAGLSVYVDAPRVVDGQPAQRIETVTFVFEAAGNYTIPGLAFDWWNVDTRMIESATVPALPISVAGSTPGDVAVVESVAGWRWLLWLGLGVGVAAGCWTGRGRLQRLAGRYLEARRLSELHAFKILFKSLGGVDLRGTYGLLLIWLQRLDPQLSAVQFADRFGDENLQRQIEQLSRGSFGTGDAEPDRIALRSGLETARHKYRYTRTAAMRSALPPLNP